MKFIKTLYNKLFLINDTPQKIAIGFGLGVFSGIIPGTGPIAALTLALIFKVNRASALIGSLLTNTWFSIVTFLLSIKLGSAMVGLDWHIVKEGWMAFINHPNWPDLLKIPVLRLILPAVIGYFIIALGSGILAYLISLLALKIKGRFNKHP